MAIDLTVNNTTFPYPEPGDEPGWGEAATDWATEVTEVLSSIAGPGDILPSSFSIANNVSSATNITNLAFDTGTVRQATISYAVYRKTDTNTNGFAETGIINLVFDNNASSGNKWLLSQGNMVGNAGVAFSITDAGQVRYTSTNITGANYSGKLSFKATTLVQ